MWIFFRMSNQYRFSSSLLLPTRKINACVGWMSVLTDTPTDTWTSQFGWKCPQLS